MLIRVIADLLADQNISVNACHPGDANSNLSSSIEFGGIQSPSQSAETPVWLASSVEAAGITGKYFNRLREVKYQYSSQPSLSRQLFDTRNSYTQFKAFS